MTQADTYIEPGSTIGIIGGGQLGQMMALSAKAMGYRILVLDPTPDCPTGQVADEQIVADYDDQEALQDLATRSDVLTYEFENVSQSALAQLHDAYLPQGIDLLTITSNRIKEKTFIRDQAQVPVAKFATVENPMDLSKAVSTVGFPAILKTVSGGYDGHGQFDINGEEDFVQIMEDFPSGELILEEKIDFTQEVSIMVTRSSTGELTTWPVAENVHRHHILRTSTVPADITAKLDQKIHGIAKKIAETLNLRGVLGIELFVNRATQQVWVNELAPRPHNSGHYTIEACNVSQFEGHIRSIVGLPLPKIELIGPALMTNLLGDELTLARADFQKEPDWHFHDYGKAQIKPGRKMGHITVVGQENQQKLGEYAKHLDERDKK
ncbi:5-(carboxyamino)imidazole ribonucleotide synthase [Lactobacillaceae bacterium L1_55_11]|nr:5-(carboxyamino)imidazole ribonucleotide synthase [Lactobacillaceae bacterium L1_55_11]